MYQKITSPTLNSVGRAVTKTLDFGSTAAQNASNKTITYPGARVGDQVILGSPEPPAKTHYTAYVSDVDEVTVRFVNPSASPVDPDSGSFTVTVVKKN